MHVLLAIATLVRRTYLYRFLSACGDTDASTRTRLLLSSFSFLRLWPQRGLHSVEFKATWNLHADPSPRCNEPNIWGVALKSPEVALLRENSCSWLLFRSCPARRHQNHCLYPNKDALSFSLKTSLWPFIGNLCSLIVCLTCIHCVLESILKYLARYSVGVDRRGESTLL